MGAASAIYLDSAMLCLDLACNAVFDGSISRCCPRCGRGEGYPLIVWLNREERFVQADMWIRVQARRQESSVPSATRTRSAA